MTIDTCIIVKNEEKTIKKLITQFLKFSNEIHITDTGSTDKTIKIIEALSKKNPNIFLHHFEWCHDFSKARNYSLTCYECKADYQFWCDGDDELNDKLIKSLKEFVLSNDKDEDIYLMKYIYYEGDPNPHYRTSLLKVSTHLKWYDPIHEFISFNNDNTLNYNLFNNGSFIIHKKDPNVNHSLRNLQIFMELEKMNYNFSCRNRYYYGRELENNKLKEYAIMQYHLCIDHSDINYVDKCNSCKRILKLNDPDGLDYYFKLIKNNIYKKDMIYYAAQYFFNKGNLELAKLFYIQCLNCKEPAPGNSFEYDNACHVNSLLQLNLVEYKLGNIDNGKKYNDMILEIDPNNETALHNKEIYDKL